ncbi:MAG: flagellar basal body P-ring protein FlgI [Planctomycetaceae bacterium]|nr:flagellar basal body P-ring protein FlgI [Planctomycetaceae bacterium]
MAQTKTRTIRLLWLPLCCLLLLAGTAKAELVRDLVSLEGAPPIPLEGIGIVTGLAATGDNSEAALTLLRKYMGNSNFDFDVASLATGNIAIVRVKAELPPFSRVGQNVAGSVTSIGDANSLEGGELLSCDLYAGGGRLYARATGQVVTGAGILTRGTIPAGQNSGALTIDNYRFGKVVNNEGILRLNLNRPNWADAYTIANRVNQTPSLNPNLVDVAMFAEENATAPVAFAKDAGQVLVRIPSQYRYEVTRYIASILEVPVSIDRPATILVNRARNSIVVTGDIRVNNAVVSLQDKMVTVRPETPEEPAAYTLADDTPRNLIELDGPGSYADLQGLIDTLNAMGLTTEQVITIFEQLRAAGAINAELINQ